ncbi:MAG: hypothetical protein KDB03_15295 [Planctomycetales bacterium]|nr:hypothetical protein [Planctomycetales bacterium]
MDRNRLLLCLLLVLVSREGLFGQNSNGSLPGSQLRRTEDSAELRYWLANMHRHQYSKMEMQQVTGLSNEELSIELVSVDQKVYLPASAGLLVLPYPGGRHPRIGFLEGAIDPQRDTKLSAFCPWDDIGYAVLDVPEAIWSNLGLTYLAHTHIDTVWTKKSIQLEQTEWQRRSDGSYLMQRRLPNGIGFGTWAMPRQDHLELSMWLTNDSSEALRDLRVQNCVMLKGLPGFEEQTNDNKQFENGYATACSADKSHWVISAWDRVHRVWGNAPCPCLHCDPKFEDCPVGETRWLRGWFSYFEGQDIQGELRRIEATGWKMRSIPDVR